MVKAPLSLSPPPPHTRARTHTSQFHRHVHWRFHSSVSPNEFSIPLISLLHALMNMGFFVWFFCFYFVLNFSLCKRINSVYVFISSMTTEFDTWIYILIGEYRWRRWLIDDISESPFSFFFPILMRNLWHRNKEYIIKLYITTNIRIWLMLLFLH